MGVPIDLVFEPYLHPYWRRCHPINTCIKNPIWFVFESRFKPHSEPDQGHTYRSSIASLDRIQSVFKPL